MSSQRSLSVTEGDRSVSVRVVTGETYVPLLAVRLEEKATYIYICVCIHTHTHTHISISDQADAPEVILSLFQTSGSQI